MKYLGFIFSVSMAFANDAFFDLKGLGHEQYQDIYVNGKVISKASNGERYLEDRFTIVNSVLRRYQRPFTLLDVGAAQGYFTFRGAELYPDSVFVMLEGSNACYPLTSKQLASICKLNSQATNVIWLDNPIIPKKIGLLSTTEHFDVILALNILHWFPEEWEYLLAIFQKMSHVLILEVPPLEVGLSPKNLKTRENIHKKLSSLAKETLNGVPRHCNPSIYTTFYVLENDTAFELETTTLIHRNFGDRKHKVFFDYATKKLTKVYAFDPSHEFITDWIPGINLITYLAFNGSFPTRSDLIYFLPIDLEADDWMPNNFIVHGAKISLIDKKDPKGRMKLHYSESLYRKIQTFILDSYNTLDEIEQKFDRIYKP